jgi:hypothetical protein
MGKSDKAYFEMRVNSHLKSYQEWCDMADEAGADEEAKARRLGYAADELYAARGIVDKADRKGVALDVDLTRLPETRIKLKEEIMRLQEACEVGSIALEHAIQRENRLLAEITDLREEVARVDAAYGEADADWEASHRRLELTALGGAFITFVVGISFGMMF